MSLEGLPVRVWPAQDNLQSLRALERAENLAEHIRRRCSIFFGAFERRSKLRCRFAPERPDRKKIIEVMREPSAWVVQHNRRSGCWRRILPATARQIACRSSLAEASKNSCDLYRRPRTASRRWDAALVQCVCYTAQGCNAVRLNIGNSRPNSGSSCLGTRGNLGPSRRSRYGQ